MEIKPGDIIYVMEKFVMNRDYPEPTYQWGYESPKIEPYHDGWYMVVIGNEENLNRHWVAGEFRDEEFGDLIDLLRFYSGEYPIKGKRHECFPEEIDIEGDIEKHCGIMWKGYRTLKEAGIEIEGFD